MPGKSLTRSDSVYKLRNPNGDPFSYNPGYSRELELIGLTLWATEGDKTQNGIIRVAASNIKLVRIFNERLKELGLSKD